MTDYVMVGKITNSHGIKGEVKILSFNDDLASFDYYKKLYIKNQTGFEEFVIERKRSHKNMMIVKFTQFDNINDILKFKEKEVYVKKQDLPELENNEYYISDLIGLEVIDQDNNPIGYLSQVFNYTNNDVYEITDTHGKKHLVPAIKEFIQSINMDNKTITIITIDGLIE